MKQNVVFTAILAIFIIMNSSKPVLAYLDLVNLDAKVVYVNEDTLRLQVNADYETHEGSLRVRGFCSVVISKTSPDSVIINDFNVHAMPGESFPNHFAELEARSTTLGSIGPEKVRRDVFRMVFTSIHLKKGLVLDYKYNPCDWSRGNCGTSPRTEFRLKVKK